MIRLNRYIASCTPYSRRQAEGFIRRGQVKINNNFVSNLSTYVGSLDIVEMNGKKLTPNKLVYYLLNKPVDYVCTVADLHADKIVTELVPPNPPVFPVGRLDKNSRGLIILTNDGELTQTLTHPKQMKEKEYFVILDHDLKDNDRETLLSKVKIDSKNLKFDSLKKLSARRYKVVIHQGMKRQIREMFKTLNYQVKDLQRTRIANIKLLDLKEGQFRTLTRSDILKLIK